MYENIFDSFYYFFIHQHRMILNKQQLFDYQNYEKKLFLCLFIFILITRGIHYQSCQYNSLIRQLFVKKVEIPGFFLYTRVF